MPKIADYLKTITDEEVKDFAFLNFGEHFNLGEKNCILN